MRDANSNPTWAPPDGTPAGPDAPAAEDIPVGESAGDGERNPIECPQPYKLCGARKRDGQPCRAAAMKNGKCRLHGGATPGGVASPHFRHGRRSRYLKLLSGDLRAGFRAALSDKQLLSLREEVALLTARTMQLLGRLRTQEGAEYEATWAELRTCIRDKGKVAAAEWKRLVDLKSVLTAEQAMTLVGQVVAAVRESVTDRATLQRIQARLLEFVPHGEDWP